MSAVSGRGYCRFERLLDYHHQELAHRLLIVRIVTVAIPICQGCVSPVLDSAMRLLVVSQRRGEPVRRREVLLGPQNARAFSQSVAELHVDIVVCAALSEALQRALRKQGVRVRSRLCGDLEAVLDAFRRRRLARNEFPMPRCWESHAHGESLRRLTPRKNTTGGVMRQAGSSVLNACAERMALPEVQQWPN